jgi:hypothetical protein
MSTSQISSNKHEAPSIAIYIRFHWSITQHYGRNAVLPIPFKLRYAPLKMQERFPRTKISQARPKLVIYPALYNIPIPVTLRRGFHHDNTPVRDYHIRKLALQLMVFGQRPGVVILAVFK